MDGPQVIVSHSEILDGVLLVSNDWSVLSAAVPFNLFPSIKAKVLEPRSFKGVKFAEHDLCLYKIPLGTYQTQFTVNLVIGTDIELDVNTLGTQVLSNFFRAVSNQPNSLTCHDWAPKPDKEKRTIFLTEVTFVGNSVLEIFRNEQPQLNTYLVVVALGQSCPYNRLNQITGDFEMSLVSQLVLHFAYDFHAEDRAIFFSREKLRNLLGKRNLKSEYYVCLLKGAGNFYFNVGHLACPENFTFVDTKFYSEAFKSFHRMSGTQFQYPELCYMLMDPRDFSKYFVRTSNNLQFAPKLSTVRSVQEYIQQYGRQISSLKARFEIIIRLEGEAIISAQQVIPSAISNHLELNPRRIERCLVSMRTSSLGIHIRRHLSPFLATLEVYLLSRMRTQETNIAVTFDPQCFLNCIAAEAVTAFTLYGNVYFRNGRYLYPTWLTKALKIGRCDYKYQEGQTPMWLFDSVRRVGNTVQFVCPEFSLTPILRKIQSRCRLEDKFVRFFFRLEEIGKLSPEEVCAIELNHIILSIAELLVVSSVDASAFKLLARLPRNYQTYSTLQKLQCLRNAATRGMSTIIDTIEFVENVFEGQYECLKFITWLSSIASFLLKERVQDLKLATRNLLEEELFEHGGFFLAATPEKKYIVVAPFSGTSAVKFDNLHLDTKLGLIDEYQFFYPPAIAEENLMQILSRDWNNRRIWEMILEIGDVAYV